MFTPCFARDAMARVLVPRCLPRPASLARPPPAHFSRHLLTARRLCTEAEPEERPPTLIVKREGGGLATVSLKHKPVNSLTQAVCEELKAVTHELEADPEVRGVVFGSGVPGVFSAGMDLRSMHNRSTDELAAFWKAVQEMWLALYMTPLATVAAISGHAPAGGCLIALACDYRVLVEGKYTIGLNEAQIGSANAHLNPSPSPSPDASPRFNARPSPSPSPAIKGGLLLCPKPKPHTITPTPSHYRNPGPPPSVIPPRAGGTAVALAHARGHSRLPPCRAHAPARQPPQARGSPRCRARRRGPSTWGRVRVRVRVLPPQRLP